jgi:hypothetical protein
MPFSAHAMPAMCMSISASTAASNITSGTGVLASVSLFILVLLTAAPLLVNLVVLISLLLTCLTGLVELERLVGLTKKLATRTVQGD